LGGTSDKKINASGSLSGLFVFLITLNFALNISAALRCPDLLLIDIATGKSGSKLFS
jgi:hypothetical protein